MRSSVRIFITVIACLLVGQAALAQAGVGSVSGGAEAGTVETLAEGTEFVMLDAQGSRILGRGSVRRGVLRLTVGANVGEFVLLVVGTDGEVVRYVGREWLRDSFRISLDGGGQVELADLVADFGVRLRLERQRSGDADDDVAVPPDPDPPTGDPDDDDQVDTPDDDDGSTDDDDDDDDDDADDDEDDDDDDDDEVDDDDDEVDDDD